MAGGTQPGAKPPEWLSLGPASRLLGVDPDTLRRWADTGRIESFSTIGGHRRFARRAIEQLVALRSHARPSLAGLGATPERMSAAYRRSYERRGPSTGVRQAVAGADRGAFRDDGRSLVEALLRHLDADDEAGRRAADSAAVGLAEDLGKRLAAGATSLTDAVSLFVAARRPFLSELGGLGRRRRLAADQLSSLYESASVLLDRLLLVFVAAHEAESGRKPVIAAPRAKGSRPSANVLASSDSGR